MNRDFSGNNFNVNKFNKVFQDNRIDDPSNEGYNNWLKDNKYDTEDILRDNSITTGNFNFNLICESRLAKSFKFIKFLK